MRLRTIKPGFFKNDLLAEIPLAGRVLFQGLWCMADREGRLEDRPRLIKVEVLPYDDIDVDGLLNQLTDRGFIVRYAVKGQRFIQIVNFLKHQKPHPHEPASIIPQHVKASNYMVHQSNDAPGGLLSSVFGLPSSEGEVNKQASPPYPPEPELEAAESPPEWFHETLEQLPKFKTSWPHAQRWLEQKGVSMVHAEQTAIALKSKWGGKGWDKTDAWATFQNWVLRPPLGQPRADRNGTGPPLRNGHSPPQEEPLDPNDPEWVEKNNERERRRQTAKRSGAMTTGPG